MRTRAYRPEVPDCLEDRLLLSSVAGLSADPIVLTRREFNLIPERIQTGFQLARRDGSIHHLHEEILDAVVNIPFGRVDGLAVSINGILNEDAARPLRQSPPRPQLGPQRRDRRDPCGRGGPDSGRRYRRAVIAAEC